MKVNSMNHNQLHMTKYLFGQPVKKTQKSKSQEMGLIQKHELKQKLSEFNSEQKTNMPKNGVLDSSRNYVDSLREARNKNKTAALEKKKLHYSFKSLSSKIISCKKSYNAKDVVSKAKREISRLKKLRSKGEYDSEELEAAIAHAQSMERVAKKKAKHLEEEEMVKAAGGFCLGNVKEEEDLDTEEAEMDQEEELSDEDILEEYEEFSEEDFSSISTEVFSQLEGFESVEQLDAEMMDLLSEMNEEMSTLMEDMGLDDLMEDTGLLADDDPDPADLKMMILKHRTKEMKDMAKADGEYLKAIFKMLQESKGGGGAGIPSKGAAMPVMGSSSGIAFGAGSVSTPAQMAGMPTVSSPTVSIDISI